MDRFYINSLFSVHPPTREVANPGLPIEELVRKVTGIHSLAESQAALAVA